ncbi:hypothetical protein LQ567_05140 [Niabella pedocola]|uniref:Uncharacterized protein n=1 Tax=Niabella pedocola TaxID=1752077 RepID=A0ABS8PM05_9BACT|nr:hypothetical protein [Niabella pedocola]MCD2422137.1 hypothetical protein [Niabella pedocola]
MIKVLFVSDGIDIEEAAFSFIRELNRETPVLKLKKESRYADLLPGLATNATVFVNVGAGRSCFSLIVRTDLQTWASNHYPLPGAACLKLYGGAEWTEWVTGQQGAIMIAGARGRSRVSELVKKVLCQQ